MHPSNIKRNRNKAIIENTLGFTFGVLPILAMIVWGLTHILESITFIGVTVGVTMLLCGILVGFIKMYQLAAKSRVWFYISIVVTFISAPFALSIAIGILTSNFYSLFN